MQWRSWGHKAPVRCHTLWQPDRPGTVRPLFPCRRLTWLASCELRFPTWGKSGPWRSFLRGSFPGAGEDHEDPTHRGRQNHMDRSMLCRRALVNLSLWRTFLAPVGTPLCVKLRTQHGGREPDSLCEGLMLSFRKQLENPYNSRSYLWESSHCSSPWKFVEICT